MQFKPKTNTVIKCKNCNKVFHPTSPNQKYCCKKCSNIGAKTTRKITESNRQETKYCLYCGNEIGKTRKKYCSHKCWQLYRNIVRQKNSETKLKNLQKQNSINKNILFLKDGFLIKIKNIRGRYNWSAFKKNKIVLTSNRTFVDFNSAKSDAYKAFA